jgi:hypothetical protein
MIVKSKPKLEQLQEEQIREALTRRSRESAAGM